MFEQVSATLCQAIDELYIPADAAALAVSFGLLDRFTAKITDAIAAFDSAEAWRETGATSMTAWLRHHTRRSGRDAAGLARTARRLTQLPVTSRAYRDGTLSTGQVQAIVGNLNDAIVSLFADGEDEFVPVLAELEVKDVSLVMQAWAQAAKDSLDPPDPTEPERSLHLSRTMDGRGELSGSLDPEARVLLQTALRLAGTRDSDAEPARTPARRRGDALVDIVRFFLDHQTQHTGGRHRPHLNIFTPYNNLTGDNPNDDTGTTGDDEAGADDETGPNGDAAYDDANESFTVTVTAENTGPGGDGETDGSPTGTETTDDTASSKAPGSTGNAGANHRPRANQPIDDNQSGPDGPTGHGAPDQDTASDSNTGAISSTGPGDSAGPRPTTGRWDPFTKNPVADQAGAGPRAWFTDGTPVDEATLHRLACDAGVHRVVRDGRSSILDYGRSTRTVPTNLFNALIARDHHCRYPGCDRPPDWCEGHHITPWEHHGHTKLDNLALYCSRHHHHIHHHRWRLTLHPDGTIDHHTPNGTTHTTHPPGHLPQLRTTRPPPAQAA